MANRVGQGPQPKRVYGKFPADMVAMRLAFEAEAQAGGMGPLTFGVPEIDKIVRTMGPKRLTTILANPSNFKTGGLAHLARRDALTIMEGRGGRSQDRHYVAMVTAEEDAVTMHYSLTDAPFTAEQVEHGEADMVEQERHTLQSGRWPYLMISQEPTTIAGARFDKLPEMTMEQILRELRACEDDGLYPSSIHVDYLQMLETESRHREMHNAIGHMMRMFKQLAKTANCPVVLAVQAKREAANRVPPIPEKHDAFYSSVIEHASDVMLSFALPAAHPASTWGSDGTIRYGTKSYAVTRSDLLVIQLLKQRRGIARDRWLVGCDPIYRHIYPLED